MAKVREYFRNRFSFEVLVTEGSRLVFHCVYYPSKCGYPRYHFENFSLTLKDMNYEISRFMSAVNKYEAYPKLDLDTLDSRLNWLRFFDDE